MGPVYASRLVVIAPDRDAVATTYHEVIALCHQWLAKWSDARYLMLLPTARKSARNYDYDGNIIDPVRQFLIIRNVARRYLAGDPRHFRDMFEEEGATGYGATISDTASEQYRDDNLRR